MMPPSPALPALLGLALRGVGASQIALAIGHVGIWRAFDWGREAARLSPLAARVFRVHTFFVALVVGAMGALALGRPDLLTTRSDLARLLLGAAVVFWSLRLVAQPLVFDPVLLPASPRRGAVRAAATLLFAVHVSVYLWAFAEQFPAMLGASHVDSPRRRGTTHGPKMPSSDEPEPPYLCDVRPAV
jgi:hypothetical protein